ncbi:MAG: prephenate dehydratase [Burkholderiales bacterium]|nr:prephenate dehydratase [Burkholderiales bacterium]
MSNLPEDVEKKVAPIRKEIDRIDTELVKLLNERAQCARAVGVIKSQTASPVFRPEREGDVIRNVVSKSHGPLESNSLAAIFQEIMSACRALERNTSVAYLGPKGTFSEMAMEKKFGTTVNGIPCDQIEEVFRAVEAGTAQFGIVPMENSTEGSVNRTMDSLLRTSLTIIGEISVPVHHNLLTQSGTMDGIEKIYSHPQSLGQCVGWLNSHASGIPRFPVSSNGEAARKAAQDPTAAAIAGEKAAGAYCLQIAAAHIQDDASNRTRFVVLANQGTMPSSPPGQDKTSLIVSVPNKAGAIYHALKPLDDHGVSMTRFESRPARNGTWAYYFYIDIEGHAKDPKIANALNDLKNACGFFKNLGSYPFEEDYGHKNNEGARM